MYLLYIILYIRVKHQKCDNVTNKKPDINGLVLLGKSTGKSPKLLQIWPRKMGQDWSLTDSSLICSAGWFGIVVIFHKFPQGDSESFPE